MKKLTLLILLLILSILYFTFRSAPLPDPRGASVDVSAPILSGATPEILAGIHVYEYTQTYVNSASRFSFKHPQGFTVTTLPAAGGDEAETILLIESSDKKVGIQILISPYGADVDITAALIRADLPNIQIDNPQTVEIGSNSLGLAFLSDSQAFGGKSREVWFVFNGNLYQISTYAEYDEFLKGLFGTWQFAK
ncbi:MAG: hypothetical protein Q7R58_02505 [bacterium]|nr:hypothetical protein [bacterium]